MSHPDDNQNKENKENKEPGAISKGYSWLNDAASTDHPILGGVLCAAIAPAVTGLAKKAYSGARGVVSGRAAAQVVTEEVAAEGARSICRGSSFRVRGIL